MNGLFDALTVTEWDTLTSKIERAIGPQHAPFHAMLTYELIELHGDLVTGWQARLVAGEWAGVPDLRAV